MLDKRKILDHAIWCLATTSFSILLSGGMTYTLFEVDPVVRRSDVQFVSMLLPIFIAPVCTILVVREKIKVAELAASNERLAQTDPLTGLLNRRAFHAELEALRARSSDTSLLFILLADIDHFKSVNDRYGHAVGDLVIQHVSNCLRHCALEDMLIARFGGEEFVMAGEISNEADASRFSEALVQHVSDAVMILEGEPLSTTISAGICVAPPSLPTDQAILRADHAMYRAKDAGRNRLMVAA